MKRSDRTTRPINDACAPTRRGFSWTATDVIWASLFIWVLKRERD